ncbi:hypothetical protein [Bifidobacterium samirii]|uniref:Uncharacterized protein n=1 Tax=Bifidobacterium samirii TaxID=2306974 RepID=A0A430FTN7_9BIFI|nr:hypothetical protein [Bifidobacterium samirii]RSX56263.1 hypothetical protein D2E24_1252 [Bifidobacterium samirii]
MTTLVMERRARRLASARLRKVAQLSEAANLGTDLPTGIRVYRSKADFMASIRAVADKVDAEKASARV